MILDIIANHTGDNWGYLPPDAASMRCATSRRIWSCRSSTARRAAPGEGWSTALRDEHQQGSTTAAGAHDGVWPFELRAPRHYTRAGRVGSIAAASTTRTPSTSAPTSSR